MLVTYYMDDDDFLSDGEERLPGEPFHIEADLYDTGDYSRLLVAPCDTRYIVVLNNEHLCTLTYTCNDADCRELEEGNIDDELVEKIGAAIKAYSL